MRVWVLTAGDGYDVDGFVGLYAYQASAVQHAFAYLDNAENMIVTSREAWPADEPPNLCVRVMAKMKNPNAQGGREFPYSWMVRWVEVDDSRPDESVLQILGASDRQR